MNRRHWTKLITTSVLPLSTWWINLNFKQVRVFYHRWVSRCHQRHSILSSPVSKSWHSRSKLKLIRQMLGFKMHLNQILIATLCKRCSLTISWSSTYKIVASSKNRSSSVGVSISLIRWEGWLRCRYLRWLWKQICILITIIRMFNTFPSKHRFKN